MHMIMHFVLIITLCEGQLNEHHVPAEVGTGVRNQDREERWRPEHRSPWHRMLLLKTIPKKLNNQGLGMVHPQNTGVKEH
ncbi:hypothetical protein HW555_000423 [Spodoptera exigua]|uniref:Secreted protein n=1 Tax=Spodoptera exigua TaxID=7107 RepID=A0A835GRP3_SPOEX|nr:hypothetical protein HW555_000423 [Spodoptera exigua]